MNPDERRASDASFAPPYARYARLYDTSGQLRFALLVHVYLYNLLRRHPVSGRRALDLACGTGTLALLLAADGWEVTGVDCSAAMLAEAEAKARAAAAQVRFIQGDMRRLAGLVPAEGFDLVTCTYDSLNYMVSEEDLAACFAAAADALASGGLYLADLNTRHFLEYDWGDCAIYEQRGYVQLERSHFDADSATSTMLLTGFVGDDAGGYERFDEVHRERAYPVETIDALLVRAGLHIEARYDGFTLDPPGPQSQRIYWVARKV